MRISLYQWLVPFALSLVYSLDVSRANDLPGLPTAVPAAKALKAIDTEGNADLAEWLQANMRASPEVLGACPSQCSQAINSTDAAGWFLIPEAARLSQCNETMLLDFVIKSDNATAIRACKADYSSKAKIAYRPTSDKAALCPTPNHKIVETPVRVAAGLPDGNDHGIAFSTEHVLSAGHQISRYLSTQVPSCTQNALVFGYSQSAVVGVFAGAELHQHGLTADILNRFLRLVEQRTISETTFVQLCPNDGLGADYTLGIIATGAANLQRAQEVVGLWAGGKCIATHDGRDWIQATIRVPPPVRTSNTTASNVTAITKRFGSKAASILSGRAECKTAIVKADDGCWALADRCGISQDDLKRYNTRANFCNTLVVGETVCCSAGALPSSIPPAKSDGTCETKDVKAGDSCGSMASKCGLSANDFMKVNTKENLCSNLIEGRQVCCSQGKLPDRRPKMGADGTCASYKTNNGDSCASIAASRDLTVKDIENFNKKTWGWNGCDILSLGFRLCVSEGNSPMPEAVSNAVCGPTVPRPGESGPTAAPKGVDLASLNPCPLKACCNVWGQCGLSDDFCKEAPSKTGAPGTSGLRNGCKCLRPRDRRERSLTRRRY